MREKVWSILLSIAILASGVNTSAIVEKHTKETEKMEQKIVSEPKKQSPKQVSPEDGEKEKSEIMEIQSKINQKKAFPSVWFAAHDERYQETKGYFYIYVRKEGQSIEEGHWYRVDMSVDSLSAQISQKIDWKMTYLGNLPVSKKDCVEEWIEKIDKDPTKDFDYFMFEIEKGKAWQATRQDAYGTEPVLSDPAVLTEEQKNLGFPYPERYYMLCGKFYYQVQGYQMYFDSSVFEDLKLMDIEKENKDIQKIDQKLEKDEKPWTGDGYFKFAIDTNNVGMTAAGASGQFHHAMYGFFLKPNRYTIKFNANGGTGTMKSQNAIYDRMLLLNANQYSRTGYQFYGWNTKKETSSATTDFGDREVVMNLTAKHQETVTLYAQWKPNVYMATLDNQKADLEAGTAKLYQKYDTGWYSNKKCTVALREREKQINQAITIPQKEGYKFLGYYDKKKGGTKMVGPRGKLTTEGVADFKMHQDTTWYAQWEPKIYNITLNHCLKKPEVAGTDKLYKKYQKGLFFDDICEQKIYQEETVATPKKEGFVFRGYYSSKTEGVKLINDAGKLTKEGQKSKNQPGNEIWYAQYNYQIKCEDYADIPCDLEKTENDNREELGVRIAYDDSKRKVTAITKQAGSIISLRGQPIGTKVGNFQSSAGVNSFSTATAKAKRAELSLIPEEGAAYQLEVTEGNRTVCSRKVYYQNGRFRTLVKLGEQETITIKHGSSIAGSRWGADASESHYYPMYRYRDCSEIKKISTPTTVYRYFQYIGVNMAYSGNGATKGKNMLEYDVSLENLYQFRKNVFEKELSEHKKTASGTSYDCKVKYGFEGWNMKAGMKKQPAEKKLALVFYREAEREKILSDSTTESATSYLSVKPITVVGNLLAESQTRQGQMEEQTILAAGANKHASSYINLTAQWNAYPTIVVTPGEELEFYEGEEVSKEDLISHLTAHDTEDNGGEADRLNPNYQALNQKIRIVKISYPASKNGTRKASEKVYQKDVPKSFLLDTYYLKLEKGENVDILVTFAVTDSDDQTTEEVLKVKVKYNHPPKISCDQPYYYLKEEVNQGQITEKTLLSRAAAKDVEDGILTKKLKLIDFNPMALKMQTEYKTEFPITYQVTDAYRKTTICTAKVIVWDEMAYQAEENKNYVRFISEEYLWTLEKESIWRDKENISYLKAVLGNTSPMETWKFTHQDVLAIQAWITEHGEGHWKAGSKANQEFLNKFAYCRQ